MIEQAPLMPSPRRSLVSSRARFSRLWASWLALALAAAPLGGCQNFGDVTGSIGGANQQLPTDEASLRAYSDCWIKIYYKNPGEKAASIIFSCALRALSRYSEASAV